MSTPATAKLPLFAGQRLRTRHAVTVAIYPRDDRPFLYARISGPRLGCVRRSTRCRDIGNARRWAELLARHLTRQHSTAPATGAAAEQLTLL